MKKLVSLSAAAAVGRGEAILSMAWLKEHAPGTYEFTMNIATPIANFIHDVVVAAVVTIKEWWAVILAASHHT